jgi:hypothetical protein
MYKMFVGDKNLRGGARLMTTLMWWPRVNYDASSHPRGIETAAVMGIAAASNMPE